MTDKPRQVDYSPDNFIAGVVGQLDLAEMGLYWLICSLIYSAGGPIPDDDVWLAHIPRGTHWRTVRAILDALKRKGKVWSEGGQLMAKGCAARLQAGRMRIAQARENGLRGGRPSHHSNDLVKPDGLFPEKLPPPPPPPPPPPIEEPPTEVVVPLRGDDAIHVKIMVENWNETARKLGLPVVVKLTGARKRSATARLREIGGIPGWQAALAKLATDGLVWMRGTNDRGWRADFDFMLQPKSFTKLIEGAYDRSTTNGSADRVQHRGPQGPLPKIAREGVE